MRKKILAVLVVTLYAIASFSMTAFAAGMDPTNWNDYYNTANVDGDGVGMYGNTNYKIGLDASEEIEFDWKINALTDEVDAWLALGFLNKDTELEVIGNDPAGIVVMVRNSGGKLNATTYKTGSIDNPIDAQVFDSINAVSTIKVKLTPVGEGYELSLNGETVELTGIKIEDFTTGGKTYIGFSAYSADSEVRDAPQDRNWTVSNVKVGGQLVEGAIEDDEDQVDQDEDEKDNGQDEKVSESKEEETPDNTLKLTDWDDPFNAGAQHDDYITLFADAAYNKALEAGDITAVIEFEKLIPVASENDWDAYVHLNLAQKQGRVRVDAQDTSVANDDLAGLSLIFRNLDGKLLIDLNGYGDNIHEDYRAWTFARKTLDINPICTKLNVHFSYSDSGWDVFVNNIKLNDEKIIIPDNYIVNDDGNTFISFLALSAGDAPEERLWRVYSVTDKDDEIPPVTGDNTQLATMIGLAMISILVFALVMRKKYTNQKS